MARIRRILHATDFSGASRAAFAKAVELAKQNQAELLVLHVLMPPVAMAGDGFLSPTMYEDLERSSREYAQKQLDVLLAKARKQRVSARSLLLDGTPAEEIARAARSKRADLIVIGTHGRSGIAKLFLGSVAGRIISMARAPVLTVRGT